MTVDTHQQCPACAAKQFQSGEPYFDDRYGMPDLFELKACADCNHVKTFPPLAESDLPALYSTYYPRQTADADLIRSEVAKTAGRKNAFLRWWMGINNQGQYMVTAGQSYFDIGCGNGNSLLEAQHADGKAYGIEADPNVEAIGKALGLNIEIGNIFDDPFPGKYFDLISLNQVIEHIPEPDAALEKIKTRLAPGGRVFLACPNRKSLMAQLFKKRWINWHVPFHQNHFDSSSLQRMAQRCGYKVIKFRTVTPNVWLLMQLRALRHSPNAGEPNPIWATGWTNEQKTDASKQVIKLGLKKIAKSLGLFALAIVARTLDVIGKGESLVVVLEADTSK